MPETNNLNQHSRVKNPNWREANQLAICKRGRGFELGTTLKIQLGVRAGLELGTSELQVQRSYHAAKKHWLLYIIFTLDEFLLFMKNLKLVFTRR